MLPSQIDELIRHLESEWHGYGPFTNSDLGHMSDSGYEVKQLHTSLHNRPGGVAIPHMRFHMNQNRGK